MFVLDNCLIYNIFGLYKFQCIYIFQERSHTNARTKVVEGVLPILVIDLSINGRTWKRNLTDVQYLDVTNHTQIQVLSENTKRDLIKYMTVAQIFLRYLLGFLFVAFYFYNLNSIIIRLIAVLEN